MRNLLSISQDKQDYLLLINETIYKIEIAI